MNLSPEAQPVAGMTLLAIPTVMYGGWIMIGLLRNLHAGAKPA